MRQTDREKSGIVKGRGSETYDYIHLEVDTRG